MRQCEICGKGSIIRGRRILLRGHYNPVSTSRKYPNLQWKKIRGKRMLICTSCLKTLQKKPLGAIKNKRESAFNGSRG